MSDDAAMVIVVYKRSRGVKLHRRACSVGDLPTFRATLEAAGGEIVAVIRERGASDGAS